MKKSITIFIFIFLWIFISPTYGAFPQDNLLFQKAVAYYKNEDYEEALVVFEKLYKEKKHPLISFYLGLTWKQVGDYDKAKKFFLEAIKGKPCVFDAYVELVQILYEMGDLKQALYWANEAEKLKIFPDKISFLKGLIFIKKGKFKEARKYFKKAKKINPSLSYSADFQIGLTYVLERRYFKAKKIFQSLIQIGPKSNIAELAKDYLSFVDRLEKSYKKWGIDITEGLFYDSNVVNKPSESIGLPSVDEITGEEDGAWQNRVRLFFRPLLPVPYGFTAMLTLTNKRYFEWKDYNTDSIRLLMLPNITHRKIIYSFPFTGSYTWLKGKRYSSELTFSPEVNFIKGKNLFRIGVSLGKSEMLYYIAGADPDEDRDALKYKVFGSYNRIFKNGKGMLFLGGEYLVQNTDGKNWDSNSFTTSGGVIYPLPLKGKMSFTFSFKKIWFENVHTVTEDNYKNLLAGLPVMPGFPTTPTKRKDEVYTFNMVTSFPVKKRIWISGSVSYLINKSNFSIYDYKKWTGGIEVILSF